MQPASLLSAFLFILGLVLPSAIHAYVSPPRLLSRRQLPPSEKVAVTDASSRRWDLQPSRGRLFHMAVNQDQAEKKEEAKISPDEATKKYGLEYGLWRTFRDKKGEPGSRRASAGELLKKYGSAYLITSISLTLVSLVVNYYLVDIGVDVPALLAKIGIQVGALGDKAGTFAIAYALHKAESPIRFPPTVALTPVVARFLGKEVKEDESAESSEA